MGAEARRVVASHALASLALSLPWPLLLVEVDARTDSPLALGVAGAARMLPYVVLSWCAARLADRWARSRLVHATYAVRAVLFVVAAVALTTGQVWAALVACTLAVAAATPAYPALVAAAPGLGVARERTTELLVTVEVAAFVVGAAVGGLLLADGAREVVPWLPVAMTLAAALLLARVRLPRARVLADEDAAPAWTTLRRSPRALRAVAVMGAVNLVGSLLALALLPLAVHVWDAGVGGYGVATGVLGLAALGGPLLRVLAATAAALVHRGLLVMAAGTLLVVPSPSVGWALVPLGLAGAAAVAVEAGATRVLQEEVPDRVRATVLGINDTVIVAAALVGSLLAPLAVALTGGPAVLGVLAVLLAGVAWCVRPAVDARVPATVEGSHDDLPAPAPPPPYHPAGGTDRPAGFPGAAVGVHRVPAQRRGDEPVPGPVEPLRRDR